MISFFSKLLILRFTYQTKSCFHFSDGVKVRELVFGQKIVNTIEDVKAVIQCVFITDGLPPKIYVQRCVYNSHHSDYKL